ncbi:MAG TPA: TRAM domain-containing protein [Kiritimatiellia bacterium]|nr:TRAM domain-containing protein [Kiritimatiellia bacterium]
MTTAQENTGAPERSVWLTFLLFLITVLALAVVIYLVARPSRSDSEVILQVIPVEAPPAELNLGVVQDAIADPTLEPVVGGRYRVLVQDNSREGTSGIARFGGKLVFVDGAAKGDRAVIEVTRVRDRTAQSIALTIEERAAPAVSPVAAVAAPLVESPAASGGAVGQVMTGRVTSISRRGDGVVRLGRRSVYVAGTTVDQVVVYEVKYDADRYAVGELVRVLSGPPSPEDEVRAPHIEVGTELEFEIVAPDRNAPERNGIGRVDNLVVIVPDVKVGDRVRVRITERAERFAESELLERLAAEPAGP